MSLIYCQEDQQRLDIKWYLISREAKEFYHYCNFSWNRLSQHSEVASLKFWEIPLSLQNQDNKDERCALWTCSYFLRLGFFWSGIFIYQSSYVTQKRKGFPLCFMFPHLYFHSISPKDFFQNYSKRPRGRTTDTQSTPKAATGDGEREISIRTMQAWVYAVTFKTTLWVQCCSLNTINCVGLCNTIGKQDKETVSHWLSGTQKCSLVNTANSCTTPPPTREKHTKLCLTTRLTQLSGTLAQSQSPPICPTRSKQNTPK